MGLGTRRGKNSKIARIFITNNCGDGNLSSIFLGIDVSSTPYHRDRKCLNHVWCLIKYKKNIEYLC